MNCWVVGADWDGEDKTPEFLKNGIWENGYQDKYIDLIKTVQVGDRIAIKSIYGQKHNLPFNNHKCFVSCMKIKAIGTVVENLGDGRVLRVNWEPQSEQEKVIYLYTYRPTIMRVVNKSVQKYIFENTEQDFAELDNFYKKRSQNRDDEISDEFILSQFKDVLNFEHVEKNPAQRDLFLKLTRFIHEAPLDWWITYSDQTHPVRFGVNNNFNGRNSTNGYIAAVGFNQDGVFFKPNDHAFFEDETEIVRLTAEKLDELKNIEFTKMDTDRDPFVGYWPENYKSDKQVGPSSSGAELIPQALNRILFGAAGTGKTYHTINYALSIIENKPLEALENEERDELKNRFDQYKEQGQIKFVTFHQSFSYEDFVEGIRAETDKHGNLKYPIKSGVFKELCAFAKKEQDLIDFEDFTVTDESIQNALNSLIDKVKTTEITLSTKTGSQFQLRTNQNGKLAARAVSGKGSTTSLSHPAIVRYLKDQSDEIVANKSYEWAIAKELRSEVESEQYTSTSDKKPYILIIDEINRGNISRIFGELITLIEDSKRAGASEALSVTLPYSKEEFSVPDNVYIIGTMNSSDRSLTGLDIALRRRFTFVEMPPKHELLSETEIDGLNVGELLKVMNQRIEVVLDRDHCIGHANFMSLTSQSTIKDLAQIFKQKIIPQLQEYFFDDWGKIDLVLYKNGMLESSSPADSEKLFPDENDEYRGYIQNKKIWTLDEDAFKSIDSYKAILGSKADT